MHDSHSPTAIMAQALQQAFLSRGEWKNWQPMAEYILARLTDAGYGIVPVRQPDRQFHRQVTVQAQPPDGVLPFSSPSTSAPSTARPPAAVRESRHPAADR